MSYATHGSQGQWTQGRTKTFIKLISLLVFLLFLCTKAEKVGKLYYEGFASELNDSVVPIPTDLVALAEKINVPTDSSQLFIKSSSIFFIIDNSGSMDGYYSEKDELIPPMDPMGNRFEVTKAIIDTLTKYPDTYPGIECGLAVFQKDLYFDDSLDALLDTLENDTIQGAYLPLMKVDSSYESGEDGSLTTQEIFYKYLTTQKSKFSQNFNEFDTTVTWEAVRLTQPRDPKSKGGTNINTGYKAAVQAMKSSKYGKENQFIVFISDGISSFGTGDDYETGAINGEQFMTTFTVFFTHDNTTPESLTKMNEAIKNNGYSASNKKYTQLWQYQNSGKEELVDFFMENIVKVFEGTSKTIPKDLKLKNITIDSHWDKDKNQFILNDLIPFTGDTTNVGFEITLETSYDTLNGDGDIETIISDTTITVDNNFWRKDPSTGLEENFESFYWDREIEFRHEGEDISLINETMTTLDLCFLNDPLESEYSYSLCSLEIHATESGDRETYLLSESGTAQLFSRTIPLLRNESAPNKGNGTLEHRDYDTFVVTFRNREDIPLPLDTLVREIEYRLSTNLNITSSAYYDNNSDGFIDSIAVLFDTDDPALEANRAQIVELLQFPAERLLTINSSSVTGNKLSLSVVEGNSTANTAVSPSEKITTKEDVILDKGGSFKKQEVAIDDSLAPVIMVASLRDHAENDTLLIGFSEPLQDIESEFPFHFYATKESNKQFSAQCEFLSFSGDNSSAEFEISSFIDDTEINAGDSINIVSENRLADTQGLFQNNSANIKREIQVLTTVTMTEATYFDNSANGLIDSITVLFDVNSDKLSSQKDAIVSLLSFPAKRNITVLTSECKENVLHLTVTEGNSTPNTAVDSDERIEIIKNTTLGSLIFLAQEVSITDSLAPVITQASLQDNADTDTLTVSFSEPVSPITVSIPFFFYATQNSNQQFSAQCEFLSFSEGNKTARFEVTDFIDNVEISEGDSINIVTPEAISDTLGLYQKNGANIKREIQVLTTVNISEVAFFDNSGDGFVDSVTIGFDLQNDALNTQKEAIVSLLKFPEERKLSVLSSIFDGSELQLKVLESATTANTAIGSDERLQTKEDKTMGSLLLLQQDIPIHDSMAPVILSARLNAHSELNSDTLEVTFSEAIPLPESSHPFFFYATQSSNKQLSVRCDGLALSSDKRRATFVIKEYEDQVYVVAGDSIHINWNKKICDASEERFQVNSANIKREIDIIEHIDEIALNTLSYFDTDANGTVDLLSIETEFDSLHRFSDTIATILQPIIETIPDRQLSVTGYASEGTTLHILLDEQSGVINTATTDSDKLLLPTSPAIGKCMVLQKGEHSIHDSLAPVVLAAIVTDSMKVGAEDYLEVELSEICDEHSLDISHPFRVYEEEDEYELSLSYAQSPGERRYLFLITSVEDKNSGAITDGDSIHIHELNGVADLNYVSQESDANIKCPIVVRQIFEPIKVELKATVLTPEDEGMYIQLEILNIEDLLPGTELSGIGQLFDPVGNAVTEPFSIEYDSDEKHCTYLWDGKNGLSRDVGSGSYLLVVHNITVRHPGSSYATEEKLGKRSATVSVIRK